MHWEKKSFLHKIVDIVSQKVNLRNCCWFGFERFLQIIQMFSERYSSPKLLLLKVRTDYFGYVVDIFLMHQRQLKVLVLKQPSGQRSKDKTMKWSLLKSTVKFIKISYILYSITIYYEGICLLLLFTLCMFSKWGRNWALTKF